VGDEESRNGIRRVIQLFISSHIFAGLQFYVADFPDAVSPEIERI
jgi:hypothetical protein